MLNAVQEGRQLILPETSEDIELGTGVSLSQDPRRFALQLRVFTESCVCTYDDQFLPLRALYYTNPTLFESQSTSNACIARFCKGFGITREQARFRAAAKGLILGDFHALTEGGSIRGTSDTPRQVTSSFLHLQQIESAACCALIIEKDTIFERLASSYTELCHKLRNPVLLITGKGYPDLSTRALVAQLSNHGMPIFGLADGDAHGMSILYTYAYGSIAHAELLPDGTPLTAERLIPIGLWIDELEPSLTTSPARKHSHDDNLLRNLQLRLRSKGQSRWADKIDMFLDHAMRYELESLLSRPDSLLGYVCRHIQESLLTPSRDAQKKQKL